MVRVLTAHHFASQDIQTCEDPVAVAAVPPDKLLIASADHVVEVRDLSKGGEAVSSFPTVDLVQHMAYCSTGNYVATLEGSPSGATGGQGCVARVYSRWDAAGAPASGNASGTASGPAQSQPMRARIAGCVTPSPAQDQDAVSLDMIELPVRGRGGATALACCQATGNVLVACHRILVFFRYIVRTHESSRTRYIDFEDTEVRVSLSFPPTQAFLREELAVCMGRHSLLVFRLHHAQSQAAGTGSPRQQEDRGEAEAGQQHGNSSSSSSSSRHRPLNLNRILELEQEVNSGRRAWGSGVAELGVTLPVTVQLPAIAAERASRGHCSPGSGVVHHSNPFVSDPADVAANVFAGSGAGASSDFQVEALLRLQLAGDPQGGHGEEFGCLTLQPLYRREPAPSASPARAAKASSSRHQGQGSSRQSQSPSPSRRSGPGAWLRSRHRGQLCGVACLVATQQEGYLYHFPMDGSPPAAHPCVAVYPFTAPVSRVVLEPLALHALTDTGLETYTLRSAHRSLAALQGVCPPADDPICLIGLRPFLGARHLLASGPHLVLLATSESSSPPPAEGAGAAAASPWTLYSLRLPTPEVLFSDMVAVGESHRVASPSTYCHLLGEAHCVLASARHLSDRPGVTASPVAKVLDDSEEALQALYRESCAHLGDFHMMSDEAADRDLAARYYRMARMEPQRVLDRMAKHAQRLAQPADHGGGGHGRPQDDSVVDGQVLSAQLHRGQVHYLEAEVLEGRQGNSGEPLDDQGARQLTSQLLELLEKRQEGDEVDAVRLAGLVLRARLLREYAATRTLALLRAAAPPTGDARASVVLALLLLEVQVGGVASATEVLAQLQTLPSAALLAELLRHWELLLDGQGQGQGLSELASVLMERRPACMAALLAQLVEAETVSLARILKIMLDHLSTQIGSSGSGGSVVSVVFQRFLETFFASFFAANAVDCHMDLATEEALKILVRSYLSDLQAPAGPAGPPGAARLEPLQQVLLDEERLPFLDAMPPFAADLGERLASPVKHAAPPALHGGDNKKLSLRKLQAVLCSSRLPRACVMEVLRFVRSQPKLYGNLSLQTLCLSVREAVAVLLDFCPQAVLRYAQDLFRTEDDWRHLLSGLDAKLKTHSQNQALRALYQQTMTDVLDHLAHSVDVDTLCRLLQLDVAGVDLDVVRAHLPHLHTCQRVAGANAVRNYIASTSAAFLSQLDH